MAIENKPSRNEDEYFARESAELIQRLRAQRDAERASASTTPSCPRDGSALVERVYHSVRIDECPTCGGVWLDKGELQILERVDETSRRSFIGGLFGKND